MADSVATVHAPAASRRTAPPESRALKSAPGDFVLALAAAAYVAALATMIALSGHHVFYRGDNPESFIPLWHHFGSELLAGRWPMMEASGWMGGNYAGEAAYSRWNPFMLVLYIVLSLFPDLAVGASVTMITMLAALGAGCFLLLRDFRVTRTIAIVFAGVLPLSGFTLFYEAAGWPMGLAAFVALVFFWWAVRKQVHDHWPPAVTFVFGFLAVTTGNPYAVLGIIIVLGCVFAECALARRWSEALHLTVVGAMVGAVSLLVYLPLLAAQPVSVRQELAAVENDTFLVPDLGDLAGASTPSYLPTVTNWGGALIESLPSMYFAWFVLPLLPWLRWRILFARLRSMPSVWIMGVVFLLATLAPSNVWLFRWPVRMVEYLYLVMLVILGIAASQGLATARGSQRAYASAAIIVGGFLLAYAATPSAIRYHAFALVMTGALFTGLIVAWRRRGAGAAMAVIAVGTALVGGFQTIGYGGRLGVIVTPSDLAAMSEEAATFQGTTLQLAQQAGTGPEAINTARLLFGNLAAPLPYESVNRYSGISYRAFADALCIDYKGQTCPEAYERLWKGVERTEGNLADALRIETLVLQRSLFTDVVADGPPAGWREALKDSVRAVWVREQELPANGRIGGLSAGVSATSVASTEQSETVAVSADGPGYVTFARLAWPGYVVDIGGEAVEPSATSEGLLQVPVPEGQSVLNVRFEAPGVALGWIATGLAALVTLAQSAALTWRRRGAGQRSS